MFSTRFFSRMTCCDLCGFDQRFGSEACLSTSASCWRRVPASKVLPEFAHFVAQGRIFAFEFFNHHAVRLPFPEVRANAIAPTEIIAQAYAHQSPCRV